MATAMKILLTLIALFVSTQSLFAEKRGIDILITYAGPDKSLLVSIRSDEPSEQKRNVSLAEAAEILTHAKPPWGGQIVVSIASDSLLDTQDLFVLLEAMGHNPTIQLRYLLNGNSPEPKEAFLKRFQ